MPNLMKAFDVKEEKVSVKPVKDYDIFKDKELLDSLRNTIISNLIDDKVPNNKLLHEYINDEIDKALLGYDLTNLERSHIFNLIDNEINGYGPITELLEDPNITEIMVNGKNEVYVEIDGQISKDDSVSFINDEHIIRTVQKIVQPLGRTIDTANPMVDARLEDGSRLNAVIPPLSLKGPVVTIRKFRRDMERIDDFLRTGAMTPYMARFLDAAVKAKLNIIICGGTGAGKTTLLRMISGIMTPSSGTITIDNLNYKDNELEIKKRISFLTGNTKLYKDLSAYELLTMCGEYYGLSKKEINNRIKDLTNRFKMKDFLYQRISSLSTGQTQRVSIARCLVHNPKYYILDEPTSGLDIISSKVILDTIKQEQEKGNCILYSTHYMEEADTICDRIIFINKGKIIATGTPSEIKKKTNTNNLRDAFFALAGDSDE